MDRSEYVNPKKTAARREAEAEGVKPAASAASAPAGGMKQTDFTKSGPPESDAVKKRKAADLARLLRDR